MNRKIVKIILILLLSAVMIFGSAPGTNTLISINTGETPQNVLLELEFNDVVRSFSTSSKDNSVIIDIVDANLGIPDVPVRVNNGDITLVQPMQLKKAPAVTRVIAVMNNNVEWNAVTRGNKIVVNFVKSGSSSARMEKTLEEELGLGSSVTSDSDKNYWGLNTQPAKSAQPVSQMNSGIQTVTNVKPQQAQGNNEKINFNFSGMTLKEIFETISNLTGLNLIVDGGVQERKINLFIQDLPVNEALELVVTSTGLAMNRFNQNTFIITEKTRAEEILVKRKQEMFQLVNSEAEDVISLISKNAELSKKLNVSSLSIDKRVNAILAFDTEYNLELLKKIIEDIDKKNGQVTIELYLVEMNRSDLNNFGMEFDNYPLSPMSMNILSLPDLKIYGKLEALAKQEKANILSSPKIRVVHGRKAEIEIGDEIPVPYYTYEEAHKYTVGATNDNIRVVEPLKKFEKAKVGIKLEVEPFVHDNREVSLDLNISVSDLVSIDNDGQLYTSNRNTTTFVRLKDKETAVLGGLIKQEEKQSEQSIPGFQRIPILRGLFRNRKKTQSNMEMLMFITPYFVNVDGEEAEIAAGIEKNITGNTMPDFQSQNQNYYNVIGELKKISE